MAQAGCWRCGGKLPTRSSRGSARVGTALAWFVGLGVVLAVAGAVLWYVALAPNVTLYVDNPGTEAISVTIDGAAALTVAPGTSGKVRCRSGQRHIEVTAGGRKLFDRVKNLQGGKSGKYLLNPGGAGRYVNWTAKYGAIGQPDFSSLRMLFQRDTPESRLAQYKDMARAVKVVPAGDWLQLSEDYILEKPPSTIQLGRGQMSASRIVLTRITPEQAALLLAAEQRVSVTEEELEQMYELVSAIERSGE
jgi:hypothetical protein